MAPDPDQLQVVVHQGRDLLDVLAAAGGGIGGLAGLWSAVRTSNAERYYSRLLELLDVTDQELVERLSDQPRLVGLVIEALDAASRADTEEKRWLLAKVVAGAFAGPDDARLDEHQLVVRTVAALEPPHVRMLVEVARISFGEFAMASELEGTRKLGDLAASLPEDQRDLALALLAALQREALVRDRAVSMTDEDAAWGVTRFGFRLLRFLGEGPFAIPEMERAVLTARVSPISMIPDEGVLVRNLGITDASVMDLRAFEVTEDVPAHREVVFLPSAPALPLLIRAGEEVIFRGKFSVPPPYDISVEWADGLGRQRRIVRASPF